MTCTNALTWRVTRDPEGEALRDWRVVAAVFLRRVPTEEGKYT